MAKYLDMGPAILTCCSQVETPGKAKGKPEAENTEKEEETDGG